MLQIRHAVYMYVYKHFTSLYCSTLHLVYLGFGIFYQSGEELFPRDEQGNLQYVDVPHMETWAALESCVDEGLVRSLGLSNFNSQQIQNIVQHCRVKPAVVQVR